MGNDDMSEETCTNCGKPLKGMLVEVIHDDNTSRWMPYDTGGSCMKCNGWMVSDSTSLIDYSLDNGIADIMKRDGWQIKFTDGG